MPEKLTTPFDPLDSPNNNSEGDEVPYDREMVIGELLTLEFDDDPPYTRAELDKMNDDQLIDLYDSEMWPSAPGDDDVVDAADEEVECCICNVVKVCEFEDEDGEPICADCEALEDAEIDAGEMESETDEESANSDDDEDDIDESEEE
jgi:hypothetical protein